MRVKFKFKFVLTTVNYCVFCLFRFCKTVFNFKFKLILRKKKYMSTIFLRIFEDLGSKESVVRGQWSVVKRQMTGGRKQR